MLPQAFSSSGQWLDGVINSCRFEGNDHYRFYSITVNGADIVGGESDRISTGKGNIVSAHIQPGLLVDEVDSSKSRKVNRLALDGDSIGKSFPLRLELFRGKAVDCTGYVGGVAKSGGASVDIVFLGAGEIKPKGSILITSGNEYTIDSIPRFDHINGGWCGSRFRAGGEEKGGKYYQSDEDIEPVV